MKPTIVQKTTNDLHSEVFKQGVHLIYFVTIVFIHIIKVGEHDVTSLQKSLQAIRCRVTDPKMTGFPSRSWRLLVLIVSIVTLLNELWLFYIHSLSVFCLFVHCPPLRLPRTDQPIFSATQCPYLVSW